MHFAYIYLCETLATQIHLLQHCTFRVSLSDPCLHLYLTLHLSSLQALKPDLLGKMALAQNKTMRVLKFLGADVRDLRLTLKIQEGKAKGDLTQYPVMKQFITHLLLGLSRNTALERMELNFPPWLSGCIKCKLTQCVIT